MALVVMFWKGVKSIAPPVLISKRANNGVDVVPLETRPTTVLIAMDVFGRYAVASVASVYALSLIHI